MRHKIHPHAFGAHQAHDQFNAIDKHLGRFVKQQMCLVKEKHQLGFFRVANFGQLLEKFRQHPQQKCGVETWRIHQLVGGQDIDHAFAVNCLDEVVDIEHGLAEELVCALAFNLQQATLNSADAGGANVAITGGELAGVVANILQHGAQVFQVQQQHGVVVGNFEHQIEHTGLRLI